MCVQTVDTAVCTHGRSTKFTAVVSGYSCVYTRRYKYSCPGRHVSVLEKRTVNPGTGKFSLPVPVKSTGVQLILVLPQTEKSWKIWLTEYSIRVSPCMHEMQRGTPLACPLVWAGQLSQKSFWQSNMPEWRRDARPSGPSAGHKPLCVSNGHHVCSAKANPHRKSPTSNRRYWAVFSSAVWQFTHIKTPHNLVCLLMFVDICVDK